MAPGPGFLWGWFRAALTTRATVLRVIPPDLSMGWNLMHDMKTVSCASWWRNSELGALSLRTVSDRNSSEATLVNITGISSFSTARPVGRTWPRLHPSLCSDLLECRPPEGPELLSHTARDVKLSLRSTDSLWDDHGASCLSSTPGVTWHARNSSANLSRTVPQLASTWHGRVLEQTPRPGLRQNNDQAMKKMKLKAKSICLKKTGVH